MSKFANRLGQLFGPLKTVRRSFRSLVFFMSLLAFSLLAAGGWLRFYRLDSDGTLDLATFFQSNVSHYEAFAAAALLALILTAASGALFLRLSAPLVRRLGRVCNDLRELQRIGRAGSWRWDADRQTYYLSDESSRILGISELVARRPSGRELDTILIRLLNLTKREPDREPVLADPALYTVEHSITWPDGSNHIVLIRGERVSNGKDRGMVGTIQDITEHRKKDLALQQSERRFRAITENTSDVTLILLDDGEHRYASPALWKVLGYDVEEVVGNSVQAYLHPDDVDNVLGAIRKAATCHGTVAVRTFRCRHQRGEWLYMAGRFTGMLDISGVNGVVANYRNVTRERLTEQSMKKLSSAVEQSKSAVIITDPDGLIEYVNPRHTQITEYAPGEVIGQNLEIMQIHNVRDGQHRRFWDRVQAGQHWEAEMSSRRKSGTEYWQRVSASPVSAESGELSHIILGLEDITEEKETHAQMEKLAFYDPLTQLDNRRLFKDRLEQCLKHTRRNRNTMALLFLDLDQFKRVNDTLGHDSGDELLITAAKRIKGCVREEDIVARLGGDEFTILLPNVTLAEDAGKVANKILAALNRPVQLSSQEVIVSGSIGITMAPQDSMNASVLMRNADLAMYSAKDQGRNNYQYFTDDMNIESVARMSLENELRQAITNDDLIVHFQPQVNLLTREVCGFEALVRWHHPEADMIPPDRFIPVAEDTGLILKLGETVLRQACRQMKLLQSIGLQNQTVAVNLSARQFRDQNLLDMVSAVLDETALAPCWLELEITESMLMDNIEQAIEILKRLKELGVSISIDDFGTGYSSLSYLTRLPVDKLKVDRSFVCNVPHSKSDMAVTTAVIAMAQKLGMQVVAEGVETDEQVEFLIANQCSVLQGYLFSQPVSANELVLCVNKLRDRLKAEVPPLNKTTTLHEAPQPS